jgi:lipopolysaccharide assembly protein A
MRTLRTLFWVVITALLVGFIAMNWNTAPVNIWPQDGGYLHFEWPVGVIALLFFLLGMTPMWLLHRISRWSMRRKLDSAERALASVKPATPPPAPLSTSPDFSSSQAEP